MVDNEKYFKISEKLELKVNTFNNKSYVHFFKISRKGMKSISLTYEDLNNFEQVVTDIIKCAEMVEKSEQEKFAAQQNAKEQKTDVKEGGRKTEDKGTQTEDQQQNTYTYKMGNKFDIKVTGFRGRAYTHFFKVHKCGSKCVSLTLRELAILDNFMHDILHYTSELQDQCSIQQDAKKLARQNTVVYDINEQQDAKKLARQNTVIYDINEQQTSNFRPMVDNENVVQADYICSDMTAMEDLRCAVGPHKGCNYKYHEVEGVKSSFNGERLNVDEIDA